MTAIVQADRDMERKVISILKVLLESSEPLGSTTVAREPECHGIYLSERTVWKSCKTKGLVPPIVVIHNSELKLASSETDGGRVEVSEQDGSSLH